MFRFLFALAMFRMFLVSRWPIFFPFEDIFVIIVKGLWNITLRFYSFFLLIVMLQRFIRLCFHLCSYCLFSWLNSSGLGLLTVNLQNIPGHLGFILSSRIILSHWWSTHRSVSEFSLLPRLVHIEAAHTFLSLGSFTVDHRWSRTNVPSRLRTPWHHIVELLSVISTTFRVQFVKRIVVL